MIIFGKPRHEYHSYRDFWTMVELCGYQWCYLDEMDILSENTYIFTGPDATHEFKGATARIIYWLLEWYGDYYQREGVSETWVSNNTYAEMTGARYVPMGSHEGLGSLIRGEDKYDIVHMSYDGIHRRSLMLARIRKEAKLLGEYDFQIAPNGWGTERDFIMRNSRLMLHIHQSDEYPAIAPLRASLAAAYGLPMVAENGWSADPYTEHIELADTKFLPRLVMETLRMKQLAERGVAFHDLLCNTLRFDKVVEANV